MNVHIPRDEAAPEAFVDALEGLARESTKAQK